MAPPRTLTHLTLDFAGRRTAETQGALAVELGCPDPLRVRERSSPSRAGQGRMRLGRPTIRNSSRTGCAREVRSWLAIAPKCQGASVTTFINETELGSMLNTSNVPGYQLTTRPAKVPNETSLV